MTTSALLDFLSDAFIFSALTYTGVVASFVSWCVVRGIYADVRSRGGSSSGTSQRVEHSTADSRQDVH